MRIGLNTFLYASPFTTASTKLFPMFKKWGFETVEIPVEALALRVLADRLEHGEMPQELEEVFSVTV